MDASTLSIVIRDLQNERDLVGPGGYSEGIQYALDLLTGAMLSECEKNISAIEAK